MQGHVAKCYAEVCLQKYFHGQPAARASERSLELPEQDLEGV